MKRLLAALSLLALLAVSADARKIPNTVDGSGPSFVPDLRTSCINVDPSHPITDWLFLRAEQALTVTGIDCIVDDATSVVMTLRECSADAGSCTDTEAAITCGTTNTTESGAIDDPDVDAGDWLRVTRGTVTGSPTQAILCATFEVVD